MKNLGISHRHGRRGFTLAELMVYLALSGVVMTSVYQLLVTQSKSFGKQQELVDVHGSLRSAASLLAYEVRQLSATDGDIALSQANRITLRSLQGTAIVCARHATLPLFGLAAVTGEITATAADSVLLFSAGPTASMTDDAWRTMKVQSVAAANLGVGACAWTGAGAPESVMRVTVGTPADTANVQVGAPVRVFRTVEYGIYQEGARWWLGRRVSGATSYEKLTGPLRARSAGGLEFRYLNAAGNPAAGPTDVAVVEFVLRAESARETSERNADGALFARDTLATKVALRGS